MAHTKDERADRERTADDIPADIKKIVSATVKKIADKVSEIKLKHSRPLLVAMDGGSSAGKSTLAILLAKEVNGVIIQGDDFCQTGIDWNQLSIAEKAEQCIDWPRARKEAIEPLLAGKMAAWRPFNFKTGIGLADYEVVRKPAPVIIIDGIYSSNPLLADILDLTILIDAQAAIRYKRHNEREGHDDIEWHQLWDEVELYYFSRIRPASSFDMVIKAE